MNVAIFTDNDFEKVNGVTTTLRALIKHAPDKVDARIYTCAGVGIDSPDYLSLGAHGVGIPFYREMKMYMPPLRRLLRHVRAAGVDVVHLTTPGPVGLAGLWVASKLGVRVIGSFHTDLAEYARLLSGSKWLGDLMRLYLRWMYRKCDRIFAPSEATRDLLVRSGLDRSTIEIWRRGVSTTLFDPIKRSAALREQWGVSAARPAVLYVGRLSREKNLGALPALSRHLTYAGVAHRVIFVGNGPMRHELEEICPDAHFAGTQTPEQVAVSMASSDVFVFPSETDTAGNVVLEAQASGLPVLVSARGGPRENMRPGETGFICDTLTELARRVALLARRHDTRRRLGIAARAYSLTREWETALEPLYRSYLRQMSRANSEREHGTFSEPSAITRALDPRR